MFSVKIPYLSLCKKTAVSVLMAIVLFGCNKADTTRPVIQEVFINNILADTLGNDTLFDIIFPVETRFKMQDNEGVDQYRFEFARTNDTLPDIKLLLIKPAGGVKDFSDLITVQVDQEVLDTIPENTPLYYFISLDCYDLSGNTAIRRKHIVKIILR